MMSNDPWIALKGLNLGKSRWREITQVMVSEFAKMTDDEQYLHVDIERSTAKFGGTVAHGYLLLAFLPSAVFELTEPLRETYTYMFYGHDKVRVHFPVLTGSSVRFDVTLTNVTLLRPKMHQLDFDCFLEVNGSDKHPITCHYIAIVTKKLS